MSEQFFLKIMRCACPCLYKYPKIQSYHQQHEKEDENLINNKIQMVESSNHQQQPINTQKISEQSSNADNIKKQQENESLIINKEVETDYTKYIEKEHPYYELLVDNLAKLNTIFDIEYQGGILKPQSDYNLEIKVCQSSDNKTNIFCYSFCFPTNYQFYQSMLNDYSLQKTFDNNIDQYLCKNYIDKNTKIVYLSYKRILIIAPRDFLYVRYTFEHENEFWSVATSLENETHQEGKVRGSINLTVTRVIPTKDGIKVNVYSQVDMKISIKPEMARNRGVTQIKKYLDKCYAQIKKQSNSLIGQFDL